MYWRVRKVSPEQVLKTYGVHVVCVASVLCNLALLTKIGPKNALSKDQSKEFEIFAERVTRHLFDNSFVSYQASKMALAGELGTDVKKALQAESIVPKSTAEMQAVHRQLDSEKTVTTTVIESIAVSAEPDLNMKGMVPVDVSGKIVEHSSGGVVGPQPFKLRYWIGQVGTPPDLKPIIGAFKEMPQGGSQPQQ